ncbi:hypothetical protein [Vibrio crassostreae]|uniref:hypothetical protein n=1 Tax=Vibrio crassostreae TaxID=246167 RepID=UPI001B317F24|nr:hypothetical protein [Vibrio crassostreae]
MATSKQEALKQRFDEFQALKRSSSRIEYTLVDRDVFRLNTKSMKDNNIVKAQIKASKRVPIEA